MRLLIASGAISAEVDEKSLAKLIGATRCPTTILKRPTRCPRPFAPHPLHLASAFVPQNDLKGTATNDARWVQRARERLVMNFTTLGTCPI